MLTPVDLVGVPLLPGDRVDAGGNVVMVGGTALGTVVGDPVVCSTRTGCGCGGLLVTVRFDNGPTMRVHPRSLMHHDECCQECTDHDREL